MFLIVVFDGKSTNELFYDSLAEAPNAFKRIEKPVDGWVGIFSAEEGEISEKTAIFFK
jgi:hypothetical protein